MDAHLCVGALATRCIDRGTENLSSKSRRKAPAALRLGCICFASRPRPEAAACSFVVPSRSTATHIFADTNTSFAADSCERVYSEIVLVELDGAAHPPTGILTSLGGETRATVDLGGASRNFSCCSGGRIRIPAAGD
jgi:hypothetical protein